MKTCTGCGEERATSEFNKRKVGKGGLSSRCKVCDRAYSKRWREENPERVRQFRENSREWQREYGAKHRKEWYWREPEKRRKRALEWAKANPEKRRAAQKAWRERNRDKYLSYQTAANARRRDTRVAMREAPVVLTAYVQVLRRDPCCYCDGPCEHIDHIDAVAKDGCSVWDNLTASCASCNKRKAATPLLQFLLS